MKRKDFVLRDEIINWLKQLKSELDEGDSVLIVEGKNDKKLFVNLGFNKLRILTVSHLSEENLLYSRANRNRLLQWVMAQEVQME